MAGGCECGCCAKRRVRKARDVSIYALQDPRTGHPRYVGQAVDPKRRFAGHMRDLSGTRGAWIAELLVEGLRPELVVLSTVPAADADWVEQWWIDGCRDDGHRLFNRADPRPLERVAFSLMPSESEWLTVVSAERGVSKAVLMTEALSALREVVGEVKVVASCG